MKGKGKIIALVAAGIVAVSGAAIAAESSNSHGAMGHGGMMDMMGMMDSCGRMMNEMAQPMSSLPQLPPGDEKLQMQMHAEMMQKMGEILSRYAAKIPDRPESTR